MPFAVLVGITALVIAWLVGEPYWIERRRRRLRARPLPGTWRAIIGRRVPLVRSLPKSLREQLEGHVQVFLDEKNFVGCDGQKVTDEVRVTIAALACLLILNRKSYYFPKLRDILVYPGAFVVERVTGGPLLQSDTRRVLSGESWTHGQVVLSWQDVLEGAADPHDGRNVVIHELAHQLDQEKGVATGAPWLGRRERYPRWSRVMAWEYSRLQAALASPFPEATLFGAYASTEPAEFFAVASEVFFERPREMAALHPEMYGELRDLYRVDPATW